MLTEPGLNLTDDERGTLPSTTTEQAFASRSSTQGHALSVALLLGSINQVWTVALAATDATTGK